MRIVNTGTFYKIALSLWKCNLMEFVFTYRDVPSKRISTIEYRCCLVCQRRKKVYSEIYNSLIIDACGLLDTNDGTMASLKVIKDTLLSRKSGKFSHARS